VQNGTSVTGDQPHHRSWYRRAEAESRQQSERAALTVDTLSLVQVPRVAVHTEARLIARELHSYSFGTPNQGMKKVICPENRFAACRKSESIGANYSFETEFHF
jgi:hypothetical protein